MSKTDTTKEEKDEKDEKDEKSQKESDTLAEDLATARATATALEKKTQEYERLLTSPEYIQYMADKARDANRQTESETDFDAMSNKDLVTYLSSKSVAEIAKAVEAVRKDVVQIEVRRQIDVAKAAHADFETYRPRMIELSTQHPSLTVEEAYIFAKSGGAPGVPEPGAPARTKPKPVTKTEAPSNTGRLDKPVKGFTEAYERAWDDVVGSGKSTT